MRAQIRIRKNRINDWRTPDFVLVDKSRISKDFNGSLIVRLKDSEDYYVYTFNNGVMTSNTDLYSGLNVKTYRAKSIADAIYGAARVWACGLAVANNPKDFDVINTIGVQTDDDTDTVMVDCETVSKDKYQALEGEHKDTQRWFYTIQHGLTRSVTVVEAALIALDREGDIGKCRQILLNHLDITGLPDFDAPESQTAESHLEHHIGASEKQRDEALASLEQEDGHKHA